MNRYKYNSRLYRDSLEKQEHYKLYKKGKLWLVAGISVFTSGLTYSMLSSHPVHAGTTATYDDANTQSVSDVTAATATATQPQADVTSTSQSSDSSTTTAANSSSTTTGTDQAATASSTQSAGATSSSTTTPAASSSSDTQSSDASASSVGRTATSSSKSTKITNKTSNDLKVKKTTAKKVTKYTKKSAQSIVAQANKLMQSTQKQIDKGNAAANAKADDNIPTDDALTAIGTHQKAQQAQVLKTVKAAQKIAVKNKKQATMKLNSALAVVANMHDELNQATALVSADKKGVQAHVVANAKAAYDKVSMPSGTSAKVDAYGDLIVTASNTKTYNKVLASLHKQGLTGSFRQVVDPEQSASLTLSSTGGVVDTDGNLSVDETKINAQNGAMITANFNISGNKGDTFYITCNAPIYSLTDGAIASTKTNADGSTTITWTLDQNDITKKETIVYRFVGQSPNPYNNIAKSPDSGNYFPGGTSEGWGGVVADGLVLPISYGGKNIDPQYRKVTYSNKRTIDSAYITSLSGNTIKKAGQNYVYTFNYSMNNNFNNLGVATAVIDLPTNFVFDPDETEYVQRNSYRRGIDANTFKILPGNKLQITTGGTNGILAFPFDNINFAGHYTDGTTGTQTFKWESLTTAYMPNSDGKAPVIPTNGAESQFASVASDFNSGHSYTVPDTEYTDTLTTTDITSADIYSQSINKANNLLIGSTTNNVLANFTLKNSGNTIIDPTYTITIPDGVESTGINLPLNQTINSNWPKDTTYNVTVNYSDGSNQSFTKLGSGETVSSINGQDVQLMNVPDGAHVVSYVITQSEQIAPDNFMGTQYSPGDIGAADGGEAWYAGLNGINDNDIYAGAFSVLGNVGTKAVKPVTNGQQLSIQFNLTDKNSNYSKSYNSTFTATNQATTEMTLGSRDLPTALTPGQVYTTRIGNSYGGTKNAVLGNNLNANAFRDSQGKVINQPSTTDPDDQTSYAGNSRSIYEPVIYITTPAQMKLVPNSKTGLPITEDGVGWNGVTDNPKVSTFVNADGLTVTKLDYTGTGFEWTPSNQNILVSFKVNDDAVSGFVPWASSKATGAGTYNNISYVNSRDFPNSGVTATNNAATKFGTTGESIAAVMVQGNELSNGKQTTQDDLQNLFIQQANGEKITGLSAIQDYVGSPMGAEALTGNSNLAENIFINAPQSMILQGTIQDNQHSGTNFSSEGINNPVPNDKQAIRLRLANNTANTSNNVAGVINLPTEVTANSGDTPGKFALQLTGPVTEGKSAAGDSTKTLYSTGKLTLSSDGKYVTTASGHKYYFNSADGTSDTTADELVDASAVKDGDWSKIVGIVTIMPKLGSQDQADTILPVKNPNSANDKGKSITIPTYFRADGLNNVTGSIKDSFATTAAIKNVDQDGKVINGYPGSTGGFDKDGKATPPTGVAGSSIANNVPTIPGYVFVNTDGDTTIKLDGSAVAVNHFQVSKADLKTSDGKTIDEALGDTAENTGAATATSTNDITFKTTDKDLAASGTYKVTGPDGKDYDTLAEALVANPTFDLKSDATAATQVFTVTYTATPVDENSVVLKPKDKFYDNDASSDPTTFDVTLANGVKAPTAGWTAADFDTTGITSQNVGEYPITLSDQGLKDLQAANTDKIITKADVTGTTFTIKKAPLTITAPTLTKQYDGKPIDASKVVATVDGKPKNGVDPKYTLTDVSKDTEVGEYPITVTETDTDNPNYAIKVVDGKLTITPGIVAGKVSIDGGSKTYDGDATTDSKTFTVNLPTDLKAPSTWEASDFDTTGITSQNVGSYDIKLSATGIAKLKAANKNVTISDNDITGGKFTINPAKIKITAPSATKSYDGQPYTGEFKATVDGKPANGDDVKYTMTDISKDVNVGEYDVTVTATATDNPNYTIETVPGKLIITPKSETGTVTVKGGTKVYDGDASTDPTTFKVDLPTGWTAPTWDASDFDAQITSQNVGSYDVTLSAAGIAKLKAANTNYTIDNSEITGGKFTITKAPITITAPSASKTYDGQPYSGTFEATIDGKPKNGDALKYTMTDISKDVDAGTYDVTITATDTDNPNYTITTVPGKLVINPKADTGKVTVEGGTKVYNGDASTDPTTFKVDLPTGWTAPTWDASDFDAQITSQNVGSYDVNLSAAGIAKLKAANKNITISNDDITGGKFTITKAPITITAPTVSKTYDGKPYGTITAKVDGKPDKGDDLKYTMTDISGDINVGNYDITVTANATDNPNYTITTVPGKLTITSVTDAKVTVEGNTKVYDGDASTDPTIFKVDVPEGVTAPTWTADDFNTSGITSQNVGSYDVTLSDAGIAKLKAANPNFNFADNAITGGKFTITKAPITIAGPTLNKKYDGKPYAEGFDATISGKPDKGDALKYQLGDISKDINVGSYDIPVTASATDNPNYNITVISGKLTITKADTVTLTIKYVDENGNSVAQSIVKTDLKDGDPYTSSAPVVQKYYLIKTPSDANGTMGSTDKTISYVYRLIGEYIVTPPTGHGDVTKTVYPNDPNDPAKITTPTTGIVAYISGYDAVDVDGNVLKLANASDPTQGYLPPTAPYATPDKDTYIYYRKATQPTNQPTTQPTQPVQPTQQPTTQPTQPVQPTQQPTTQPTQPVQPTTQPTQQPAQPTTQPTPKPNKVTPTPSKPNHNNNNGNNGGNGYGNGNGNGNGGMQTLTNRNGNGGNGSGTFNNLNQSGLNGQSNKANAQYPTNRLPQTGDDQNDGTVILGVVGMLSTLGLAALRRKRRRED